MSSYTKLDAALVANIGAGMKNLGRILGGSVRDEAARLAILTGGESWRIVDRRLQALRKAKKIVYGSKSGWTVVQKIAI